MEFENILNLVGKNEIFDVDNSNSPNHDTIVVVRAIEMHKDEIRKDPEVLFPKFSRKTIKHIYGEYCSTSLHNGVENLPFNVIKEAVDLCFLY